MCLAVPGRVVSIDRSETLAVAKVDFNGIIRDVALPWQDMAVGDCVLVHAGIALSRIDPAEADAVWKDLESIAMSLSPNE